MASTRVHYLRHVPFEGLGSIRPWLEARHARVTSTRLYEDPRLPSVADFDWLIVMGGPMGANDDHLHPWLFAERALIADAVEAGKVVLGICLGAQLLARALGARVYRNPEPEIGWFRVEAVAGGGRPAGDSAAGQPLPLPIDAFHWHGDTFDLPAGSTHLARSAACAHQAFSVGPRILGLQFHLEMTPAGACALAEACGNELHDAPWIQPESEMLRDPSRFERVHRAMDRTLEWLARP
jgi:GMP synthase-like glutamine amidotransferase